MKISNILVSGDGGEAQGLLFRQYREYSKTKVSAFPCHLYSQQKQLMSSCDGEFPEKLAFLSSFLEKNTNIAYRAFSCSPCLPEWLTRPSDSPSRPGDSSQAACVLRGLTRFLTNPIGYSLSLGRYLSSKMFPLLTSPEVSKNFSHFPILFVTSEFYAPKCIPRGRRKARWLSQRSRTLTNFSPLLLPIDPRRSSENNVGIFKLQLSNDPERQVLSSFYRGSPCDPQIASCFSSWPPLCVSVEGTPDSVFYQIYQGTSCMVEGVPLNAGTSDDNVLQVLGLSSANTVQQAEQLIHQQIESGHSPVIDFLMQQPAIVPTDVISRTKFTINEWPVSLSSLIHSAKTRTCGDLRISSAATAATVGAIFSILITRALSPDGSCSPIDCTEDPQQLSLWVRSSIAALNRLENTDLIYFVDNLDSISMGGLVCCGPIALSMLISGAPKLLAQIALDDLRFTPKDSEKLYHSPAQAAGLSGPDADLVLFSQNFGMNLTGMRLTTDPTPCPPPYEEVMVQITSKKQFTPSQRLHQAIQASRKGSKKAKGGVQLKDLRGQASTVIETAEFLTASSGPRPCPLCGTLVSSDRLQVGADLHARTHADVLTPNEVSVLSRFIQRRL